MHQAASAPSATTSAEPGPSGYWLPLVRGLWLLIAGGVAINCVPGIPAYYAQQRTACTTNLEDCSFNNLTTPGNVQALHRLGLSLECYAAVCTIFAVVVLLIFLAVGALIFWRKSRGWLGLFTSLVIVIEGTYANNIPNVAVTSGPLLLPYTILIYLLTVPLLLGLAFFLLTFPTGRLAPRWSWVVIFLWVGFFISFLLPDPYAVSNWPGPLFAFELLIVFGGTLLIQIYRYRRLYTPLQRQQTKWLVFGGLVCILIEVLFFTVGNLVPEFNEPDSPYQLLNNFFSVLLFVPIPIAVGIAILRYQLWDIDTIINRALVYGSLSALLGTLYIGLILGLTALASTVTGQADQPVALVIATLAIAALFLPVRRRIQALIDRRFYRQKYNAEKALAAFSATLRNEVDLEEVRLHLLNVINETMQPAHASLWLRQPGQPQRAQATKE